jgi:hypothetical protein
MAETFGGIGDEYDEDRGYNYQLAARKGGDDVYCEEGGHHES